MNRPSEPTPDDLADAKEYAWRTIDRAIGRYHETKDLAARGQALQAIDDSLSRWVELETDVSVEAENHLLRCILATIPEWHPPGLLLHYLWPTRGIRSYDMTYLAVPEDQHDISPGRVDGPNRMRLVVFRADAVLDLTDASVKIVSLPNRPRPRPTTDPMADSLLIRMVRETVKVVGEREVIRRLGNLPPEKGGAGATDPSAS